MTTFDRDRLIEAIGITAMWVVFIAYIGTASPPHGNLLIGLALAVLVYGVWSIATNLAVHRRLPSLRRRSPAPRQDWRATGIGSVAGLVSLIPIGIVIGSGSWLVVCWGVYVAYIVEVFVRRPMTAVATAGK